MQGTVAGDVALPRVNEYDKANDVMSRGPRPQAPASDDPHPRGVRAPPNAGPNLGASRSALRKTPAFVPIAHFHRGQTSIKDVSTTLLGLNIDF